MTAYQMFKSVQFATALSKLKASHTRHQSCELTRDEVAGLIWGIQNLRAGAQHDAADHPA
jgi:hypothetical protein